MSIARGGALGAMIRAACDTSATIAAKGAAKSAAAAARMIFLGCISGFPRWLGRVSVGHRLRPLAAPEHEDPALVALILLHLGLGQQRAHLAVERVSDRKSVG